MPVDRSELQLIWPPALFTAEARALLDAGEVNQHAMGWLLAEAFHGDAGYELFQQEHARGGGGWGFDDPWSPDFDPNRVRLPSPAWQLIEELIAGADSLPAYRPKRYYRARQAPPARRPVGRWNLPMVMLGFAELVNNLAVAGYFGRAFGSSCCDDADDPTAAGQRQLSVLLNENQEDDDPLVQLWPPLPRGEEGPEGEEWRGPQPWSDGLFYDVVEALHDLVARPRSRIWHDFCQEWDYADVTPSSGRAVYRWRVNQLLDRSNVPLRLAEDGEDVGLLVTAAGDAQDDLVHQVLDAAGPRDRSELEHAVAMFRGRAAGRQEKRSAVLALTRLFEDRKAVVRQHLEKPDESALFNIANNFDLRHRGLQKNGQPQQGDYDEVFLDWMFWWYLATVDLTDKLVARQGETT